MTDYRVAARERLYAMPDGWRETMTVGDIVDVVLPPGRSEKGSSGVRVGDEGLREALEKIADLGTRSDWPQTAAEAIGIARVALEANALTALRAALAREDPA